jgi:hypothetical protein
MKRFTVTWTNFDGRMFTGQYDAVPAYVRRHARTLSISLNHAVSAEAVTTALAAQQGAYLRPDTQMPAPTTFSGLLD